MYSVIARDMNEILVANRDIDWKMLTGRTFLVTGANGMIASYFIYFLLYLNDVMHLDIRVVGLIRDPQKAEKRFADVIQRNEFSFCVQDICKKIQYDRRIDYVLHAASPTSPDMLCNHPVEVIQANVMGTRNVLEFARKNKSTVLFLSTREIYGKRLDDCMFVTENELGILNPSEVRSCYPESKRMAENMCVSYAHEYGVVTKIARIAHTYGPGMPLGDGRVMSDFLQNVVHSENIVLNSDGSTVLALTYLSDTISGLMRFLLKMRDSVCNISSDRCILSVKDLANMLCQMFPERKMSVQFKTISCATKKGYLQYAVPFLSSQRMYKAGWNPSVALREGIERTILFYEGTA